MEFLHWSLLGLLPLAAVPILLHLLTLHRLKTVELSTFRFLFDSYIQQRRRMRFLEALLAFLRTLFLLVLVLLFARPVVKSWAALFPTGSGRDVVLLLDTSASMNARTKGIPAIRRAKDVAQAVVERLHADDRLTIVQMTAKPKDILNRFAPDPRAVRELLEAVHTVPARANVLATLAHVFGPGSPVRGKPLVYLISDGQASGWREAKEEGVGRLIPAGTRLMFVDVGHDGPVANRAAVGDPPKHRRGIVGLPLTFQARVLNDAKEPAEATLSLFIDEKEVERVPLAIKPGVPATHKFLHVPNEPGPHQARFEVSGRSADDFPDDDRFLFSFTVDPAIKVLLVNGNPAPDPFENEALYLKTALSTSNDDTKSSGAREFVRALDVREIPEGQLNPEALRDTALAIVANCGGLNGQHFAWLREFVAAGGGLLVFPGDKVNPDVYNTQFFTVPNAPTQALTPAKLGPPEGDPEKPETFERLAAIDFAHPALTVFDDPDGRYLRTAYISRRFGLTTPEERGGTWPLAQFSNGKPALVEGRYGDGIFLLAAFPANAKWSNLPLKPEFVPLVLRLVSYARHRPELDTPSVVPADGVAEVAVAASWAPVDGTVTEAAGHAHKLAFERSNSRLVAPFEETSERGYYAVNVKGGRVERPKAASGAFAVNLAPEESRFARLSESDLKALMPDVALTFVDATSGAQQKLGGFGEEKEIWRPLILALFAIIGVEFMLSTLGRPSGERRAAAEPGTT
jgi:hypothetical protein